MVKLIWNLHTMKTKQQKGMNLLILQNNYIVWKIPDIKRRYGKILFIKCECQKVGQWLPRMQQVLYLGWVRGHGWEHGKGLTTSIVPAHFVITVSPIQRLLVFQKHLPVPHWAPQKPFVLCEHRTSHKVAAPVVFLPNGGKPIQQRAASFCVKHA